MPVDLDLFSDVPGVVPVRQPVLRPAPPVVFRVASWDVSDMALGESRPAGVGVLDEDA